MVKQSILSCAVLCCAVLGRCFQRQPPRYYCTNLLQFKELSQYVFATRKAFAGDDQTTIAQRMICVRFPLVVKRIGQRDEHGLNWVLRSVTP